MTFKNYPQCVEERHNSSRPYNKPATNFLTKKLEIDSVVSEKLVEKKKKISHKKN